MISLAGWKTIDYTASECRLQGWIYTAVLCKLLLVPVNIPWGVGFDSPRSGQEENAFCRILTRRRLFCFRLQIDAFSPLMPRLQAVWESPDFKAAYIKLCHVSIDLNSNRRLIPFETLPYIFCEEILIETNIIFRGSTYFSILIRASSIKESLLLLLCNFLSYLAKKQRLDTNPGYLCCLRNNCSKLD